MKKTLLMLTATCFILFASANTLTTAKEARVANYKEVLSKIEYPQVCKEKGIEGKVIVSLRIDSNGKMMSHEFLTYPCDDLKVAVAEALSELKFIPAVNQHGEAVTGKVILPVNFKLTI